MGKITQPGINRMVNLRTFQLDDEKIIKRISREWYVTNGGENIQIGPKSVYRYILIKPTAVYQEMFNLEREIVVIFSRYENFEPRTVDAIDYVIRIYQSLRLEKICSIIISRDDAIGTQLTNLLRSDHETQIIVPFTYSELLSPYEEYFMQNRFRQYFYTRDLFDFESPLKKDFYFFGRSDLIHSIVNRHKSHENFGLFGLRRTGKTSLIFGIQRALTIMDGRSIYIDCEDPAFHSRRWNKALYYIIYKLSEEYQLHVELHPEENYTEENASILFEKELLKIHDKLGKKDILIIFDEIENITFNISFTEHWEKGLDFVFFWQALRSIFQRRNIFTYLVVGTNPMCIETSSIRGKDNPLFNQMAFEYIPNFNLAQTQGMIGKLGRLMGLEFQDLVYAKLLEDFGGHPFLMRRVCSEINALTSLNRPTLIGRPLYNRARQNFNQKNTKYIEMVLDVLRKFYDHEYSMLEYLAQGDFETFNDIANSDTSFTNHLLGYGIIEIQNNMYSFKIEAVKEYLAQKQRYHKINLQPEEMLSEISERRNALEPKIRLIVRSQLMAMMGKPAAKESVLNILGESNKSKLAPLSYEDLFNLNVSKLYFDELRKIILKNWDVFKHIFTQGREKFDEQMQSINKYRKDAHAAPIDQYEMSHFRICISEIEKRVEDFLSLR